MTTKPSKNIVPVGKNKRPILAALAMALLGAVSPLDAADIKMAASVRVQSTPAAAFGVTPPLSAVSASSPTHRKASVLREVPRRDRPTSATGRKRLTQADPVLQGGPVVSNMPSPLISFEGLSNIDGVAPSDCNGDVGPNHYVEMVNMHFCIYDKATGDALIEPMLMSSLFSAANFAPPASTMDNGDPIVLYDPLADRWMISQFIVSVRPCHEVIAISQTPDPTGPWFLYDFVMPNNLMNDYPKFGVWPDAYTMTDNQFGESSGAGVFAFDRVKMLAGDPAATYQYFNLIDVNPNFFSLLPADLDGPPPPAGSPSYFLSVDKGSVSPDPSLYLWKFSVDWDNPSNSTFGINGAPDQVIPVADFNPEFSGGRDVIPQKGTNQKLDAIGDGLMYRLQYRHFSERETLTVCHTVNVGDNRAGVRYYILERSLPGGEEFTVADQATYAPDDGNSRWMGSAALDGTGNLAVGFSISGTNLYPSIRYAGRMHYDPTGGLWRGEASLVEGTASQTGVNRWGDYSMMAVDPTDEATFWFNAQYTSGSWNWKTRIGSFIMSSSNLAYVTGIVTNALTGAAVPGARVICHEGGEAKAAADGSYRLSTLAGDQRLTAVANGYWHSATTQVALVAGMTSQVDFALMPVALSVSPGIGSTATGEQGGPYLPSSFTYTLSNAANSSLAWNVAVDADWLAAAPSSGILAPFTATGIVVSLTQPASFLPFGVATGLVQWVATNSTHSFSESRSISLVVTGASPTLAHWDFNTGQPSEWQITGAGWSFDDPGQRGNLTGGTGIFAIVDSDYIGETQVVSALVSPVFDFSGFSDVTISFKTDFRHYSGDLARVDYSLAGTNGPWTSAWTVPAANLPGPRTRTVVLPPAVNMAPHAAFRFYYEGYYAWWWQVDDVELSGVQNAAGMTVVPVTDWAISQYAGSIPSEIRYYRLSASGTGTVACVVSSPDWMTCSPSAFTLHPGQSAVVTAAVAAASSTMANGEYPGVIVFSNTLDHAAATRTVTLDVLDPLQIAPSTPYVASGLEGGPFTPTGQVYTLRNNGTNAVEWGLSTEAAWVTIAPTNGTIAGGSAATVTVAVVSALLTNSGIHMADLVFTNLSVGSMQTRSATINVREITGSIGIYDSIGATNDLSLPFGVVTGLTPRVAQIIIANTGENSRNLVVSNLFFGYYLNLFDGENAENWFPVTGDWSVSGGAYRPQSQQSIQMQSNLHDLSWSNAWVETEVNVSQNVGSYGLGCRVTPGCKIDDNGNGYFFIVDNDNGSGFFLVFRQYNGIGAVLQGWTLTTALKTDRNVLSMNTEGGNIRCYLNGTPVWDGIDEDPLPPGGVCLIATAEASVVRTYAFDSILVGPPRERGLGVGRKQLYYNGLAQDGNIFGPFTKDTSTRAAMAPDIPDENALEWPLYAASATSQPPFMLSGLPDLPVTLAPGNSFTVDVAYISANLNSNLNVVTILSNANDMERMEVAVEGRQAVGVITGQVTDAWSGAALSNANVRVDQGPTNYVAMSDADGAYSRVVPVGAGAVTVSHAGYATSADVPFALSADGETSIYNVALVGGCIAVSTGELVFTSSYTNHTQFTQSVVLHNTGVAGFDWTNQVTYNGGATNWLLVQPSHGSLPQAGERGLSNRVDTAGVGAGTHGATVTMTSPHATNSPLTYTVTLTLGKGAQAIVFANPGLQIVTNITPLTATASSGLPVSFTVVSGAATLTSPTTLAYPSPGLVTVRATQPGDANWRHAVPVDVQFRVRTERTYADFDGDRRTDQTVFWPQEGRWYHWLSATRSVQERGWGWSAVTPVPADYDGDLIADVAIYHRANGAWYIRKSSDTKLLQRQFGWAATEAVPGDYDGDGFSDFAVHHRADGRWYILRHDGTGFRTLRFGWHETVPVPADYDGDGTTDIAVYWPVQGRWFIMHSRSGRYVETDWGFAEALPVPADYDGDGIADLAVYWPRTGTWYIRQSTDQTTRTQPFGWSRALPVPGDFDGDGIDDIAVYEPGEGLWSIMHAPGSFTTRRFGWSQALPPWPSRR